MNIQVLIVLNNLFNQKLLFRFSNLLNSLSIFFSDSTDLENELKIKGMVLFLIQVERYQFTGLSAFPVSRTEITFMAATSAILLLVEKVALPI